LTYHIYDSLKEIDKLLKKVKKTSSKFWQTIEYPETHWQIYSFVHFVSRRIGVGPNGYRTALTSPFIRHLQNILMISPKWWPLTSMNI